MRQEPPRRRVLVIDDDEDFAESLRDVLDALGYDSAFAASAEAALLVLAADPAPVAVIDIRLGETSGVDALATLRAAHPELVGVMITAHADTDTAIRALRNGAYDYIDKASHPAAIAAVLDRCFETVQLRHEREAAYDALRQAKEAAEAASRSKSEFLATVSHELRTPLNAIIGFSEVMMGASPSPPGSQVHAGYVRDIHASGIHLLSIINDILDLSKAESGKLELNEDIVDLADVLDSASRLVRNRADEATVALELELPKDLPYFRGDERKLRQIALNLISNAVKFTPGGGRVTLSLRVDESGCFVLVVADTGIGMSEEDIPKALEPFCQIDNRLSRKYEGIGLGLPITAAMVRLHEAKLEVASRIGEGTTFTIIFPAGRTLASTEVAA